MHPVNFDFIKCDWIWEKPASTHNYKSLEIPILIVWGVLSREGEQVLVWNSPQFYRYLYSTHAPTVEWIASCTVRHFRWFFTGVVNTTSIPPGWKGGVLQGGRVGSSRVGGWVPPGCEGGVLQGGRVGSSRVGGWGPPEWEGGGRAGSHEVAGNS